jgi:hypothetical protein
MVSGGISSKKIAKEYINIQGYIGGEILKRAWE